MKLRLVEAKPRVAELLALYRHAWWTRRRRAADVRRMLRHSDLCFCARKGKELVGFARVTTDFAYRAVIWDLIVHPDYYRRGIGSSIVRRILRHPRLRGVEGFWLFTTDKQAFYKKLGFRFFPRNLMVFRRR